MEDLIIYETSMSEDLRKIPLPASNVPAHSGDWRKIPYLKELGINAVELMPILNLMRCSWRRLIDENQLIDYWGYNPVSFFSPNSSYASKKRKIMKEPSSSISSARCMPTESMSSWMWCSITPVAKRTAQVIVRQQHLMKRAPDG